MKIGWNYIRSVVRQQGMGPWLVLLVMLSMAGALLEGVGVGFLLPLLESLQNRMSGQDRLTRVSVVFEGMFRAVGLPWTLTVILVTALCIFIIQSLLVYLRFALVSWTQNRMVLELRSQLFANLTDFDLAFYHRSKIGELVNTLITEAYRAGYAFRAMVEMFAAACVLTMYVLVAMVVSWKMTLIAFPVLGLVAILLRPRRSYELGVEYSRKNDNLQIAVVESLGGIREIMSLGLGKLIGQQFRQTAQAVAHLDFSLFECGARFTLFYQTAVFAIVAGMVYIVSELAELSLVALLVFLVVLQRLSPRVGAFTEQRHVWLGSAGSMEKVEQLLAETEKTRASVRGGPVVFRRLDRGIEFKEVRFRHAGHDDEILAGVSFLIPKGQAVAIVGTSGAGKSTILDLLVRFYDPSDGKILVDNHDLRDLDLASWRRSIGLVSQETFLFHDSIENNIRYGDHMAAVDEVVGAAKRAYAHQFISEMPDSYATIVGDRGSRLSGGQRQRIALARAILRRPQVLILDEATSDLDSESELYIQQAIREIGKACTVIMVAHRLSAVEHADRIFVLEGGVIKESGTHEELLGLGGRYAQFYQTQFRVKSVLLG